MSALILATKLYIPRPRPSLVHRTRLLEPLNDGLHRRLTLVSAPAGLGKTTLVSEWIAGAGEAGARPAAWLSLEQEEGDPGRFVSYLVAMIAALGREL